MIVQTAQYKAQVKSGATNVRAKVAIVDGDVVVRELPAHRGSVTATRSTPIRRAFSASVTGLDLVPSQAKDLLSTYGTVLKVYRGLLIPVVFTARDRDTTQSELSAGVLDKTAATPDGDLVINYV